MPAVTPRTRWCINVCNHYWLPQTASFSCRHCHTMIRTKANVRSTCVSIQFLNRIVNLLWVYYVCRWPPSTKYTPWRSILYAMTVKTFEWTKHVSNEPLMWIFAIPFVIYGNMRIEQHMCHRAVAATFLAPSCVYWELIIVYRYIILYMYIIYFIRWLIFLFFFS